MSVDRFFDRKGPEKLFILEQINKAKNSEEAMDNYRECLERINSREVYERYLNSGFFTIIRDDSSTIENTLNELVVHFGF